MPNDRAATVPASHLLLALAVVAVWGSNFVVIKQTLDSMPPLLFALLRFCFAFLPAAVFIRRPKVPLRRLAAYGVLIGAGQFGLLYVAVAGHISPGLASLVVQMQVFFTVVLAVVFDGERPSPPEVVPVGNACGFGTWYHHLWRINDPALIRTLGNLEPIRNLRYSARGHINRSIGTVDANVNEASCYE